MPLVDVHDLKASPGIALPPAGSPLHDFAGIADGLATLAELHARYRALQVAVSEARTVEVRADGVDAQAAVEAARAGKPLPKPTKPAKIKAREELEREVAALVPVMGSIERDLRAAAREESEAATATLGAQIQEAKTAALAAVDQLAAALGDLSGAFADKAWLSDLLSGRKLNHKPQGQYIDDKLASATLDAIRRSVTERGVEKVRPILGGPRLPASSYVGASGPEATTNGAGGRKSAVLGGVK